MLEFLVWMVEGMVSGEVEKFVKIERKLGKFGRNPGRFRKV
jgi:hypothetical protein